MGTFSIWVSARVGEARSDASVSAVAKFKGDRRACHWGSIQLQEDDNAMV